MGTVETFIAEALFYKSTPYKWGGDDPSGFDCSGLVVECLKSAGMMGEHEDATANDLMIRFSRIDKVNCKIPFPVPGALVFQLRSDGTARHVEICVNTFTKIGANGGGSNIKTESDAWKHNAFIKTRKIEPDPRQIFVYPFPWL